MSEQFEHNLMDHEDPLAGPTWIIGLLGAVLLLVICFGLVAVMDSAENYEFDTKEAALQYPVVQLDAEQMTRITGQPRWRVEYYWNKDTRVEVSRNTVLPIDMAMQKIVDDANRRR